MVQFLVIAGIAGFVALWWIGMSRAAGGRVFSSLWLGFSAAAGALLFLAAGLAGYNFSKHERHISQVAWSNEVVWWQVYVGLTLALFAAVLFNRAARRRGTGPHR